MEEPVCKKMKRDLWGNPMETVTETEVSKLQKEIIDEGINKKSYTDSESDDDSDEEVIKLFKKKSDKFDTVGYSFTISNKLSKTRSELARAEERLRYLQLDYNNNQIKLKEITDKAKALQQTVKQTNAVIVSQKKEITFFMYLSLINFCINIYFNIGRIF
jgi:chromosome segregation ATPase